MPYTTTKCPHCGYRTRSGETGVKRVELGQTIACCPGCGMPIMDPINTEYEFMSKIEQKKWSTDHLASVADGKAVFMLILGIIGFIAGMAFGEVSGVLIALFSGGLFIYMCINAFNYAKEMRNSHYGEQLIYESLLRTSNNTYVELLKNSYGKKRTYRPIPNRFEIIEDYKKYSTEDIHKKAEEEFSKLLNYSFEEEYLKMLKFWKIT